MAGSLYIWIMGGVFIGVVGVMALLLAIFRIGHWFEKKQTGATHGFLEIPQGARGRPAPRSTDLPPAPKK